MSDNKKNWYYDLATGEVSQGPVPHWENRMGPYATKDEALHALSKAKERNAIADAHEDDWHGVDEWHHDK